MIPDLLAKFGSEGMIVVGAVGIYVAAKPASRAERADVHGVLAPISGVAASFPDRGLLDAMQLIADVYHLQEAGHISRRVWKVWEREIRKTLTGPVFQREWQKVATEFAHTMPFVRYIDQVMRSQRAHNPLKHIRAPF